MSVQRFLALSATALTLLTAFGIGLIWAADTRYVSRDFLAATLAELRLASVNDVINELEIKVLYSEASKADQVRLQLYRRKREELISGSAPASRH